MDIVFRALGTCAIRKMSVGRIMQRHVNSSEHCSLIRLHTSFGTSCKEREEAKYSRIFALSQQSPPSTSAVQMNSLPYTLNKFNTQKRRPAQMNYPPAPAMLITSICFSGSFCRIQTSKKKLLNLAHLPNKYILNFLV